jgi:hypothetical protein
MGENRYGYGPAAGGALAGPLWIGGWLFTMAFALRYGVR